MTPTLVFSVIAGYFSLLVLIAYFTSKNTSNRAFFSGDKSSPWYLVAFGMIGASLSGVTFISVPGWVASSGFSYLQMVLGYLVGYFVIATVLIPLYYRLNLTSIYSYLDQRFGKVSYHTGSAFFIISRTIGASFRLYLVATVLQLAFFDAFSIPFWVTVLVTIALIWIYTFRAGIKTIVWTDTLQTFFMLAAVIIVISLVRQSMHLDFTEMVKTLYKHPYTDTFNWDWRSGNFFFKQFLSGAFMAIVMTGLDQDMMQKNLTCPNSFDAQKNMFWLSIALVPVNLLFLSLGVLLYLFAQANGIALPAKADELFPMLAMNHLGVFAGIVFLLGVIAAAFSSADSALTSLTTAFSVDFLGLDEKTDLRNNKTRLWVHLAFSLILFFVIVLFHVLDNDSIISAVFTVAGYTYGPLLGLYSFGLFTKRVVKDKFVLPIAILSPLLAFVLATKSADWFAGYKMSYELLIINGAFTFIGLFLISQKQKVK